MDYYDGQTPSPGAVELRAELLDEPDNNWDTTFGAVHPGGST